jgi:NADH-quinone oxidoreductase subunit G
LIARWLETGPVFSNGGAADKSPFRSRIDDFYFAKPIVRSSAVMAECSATAHGRIAKTAVE